MPTGLTIGDTTARTVDDQFLDLVCSDADLLAAEFDAIIAAEWSEPPVGGLAHGAAGGHGDGAAAGRAAEAVRAPVPPRHPGVGGWARQRSPPPAEHGTGQRKAGDRHT